MDCLVLAEQWSSWSFALQALWVERLSTVVVSASAEAKRKLQGMSVASSMREVKGKLESVKDRVTPSTLVFIQGLEAFAVQMEGLLDGLVVGGLFTAIPYSALSKLGGAAHRKYKVTYRQFGGVTTGAWDLHSSVSLASLKSTSLKCPLIHVLSSTEKGIVLAAW